MEDQGTAATTVARHVLCVGSGKGGVGKSTVSLNLAVALAQQGHVVGLLDADLFGPNIPVMVGLTRYKPRQTLTLVRNRALHPGKMHKPVERHGVYIASAGFLFGEDQGLSWQEWTVATVVRQLTHDVDWPALDYLVVDLPPGTGTVQQAIVEALPQAVAILVVTPQRVAHLDARKGVDTYRRAGRRLLGAVENMAGMPCPHCGEDVPLFPRVPESRSIWSLGVERLASLPFDPAVGDAGDTGEPITLARADSVVATRYRELATVVTSKTAHK